jgi:hypothetical protein
MKRLTSTVTAALLVAAADQVVAADSLSGRLQGVFGENGITLQVSPPFSHTAHFSSASLATLGSLTQQLAPRAADFPAISTVPGFTYRYNSELQTFERSSSSLGSIYVERPQTVGRGKFDFGLSYLYQNFSGLNGTDLSNLRFDNLGHGKCCGGQAFENATATVAFNKFDLESHVITLSGTYGITDNWDVNLLLPIINTTMDVTATASINDVPFQIPNGPFRPDGLHYFPNGTKQQTASTSDSAAGVGDLQIRTKYHFFTSATFNASGGLNLRLPTGDAANFQGLDDVVLTPYVALAQEFGAFDLHGTFGFDVYTEDQTRSRARYAVGAAYQAMENLAFIADMIGSSNLTTQSVSVRVPEFAQFSATPTSFSQSDPVNFRTDVIDLALGMKYSPMRSVVGFLNVFVPLTDDGLRADVVPSGGVQVSF